MNTDYELRYRAALADFRRSRSTDVLATARTLSQDFVEAGITSDEIVAAHTAAMETDSVTASGLVLVASQQFLLEVMIAYGVAYSTLAERLLTDAAVAAAAEHARVEDAERAETERLELLAGVSHELGTPLTVVKGNVSGIRRFLEEHNAWPAELTERADDVEFAVERMLALREELLAASRNEQRALELVPLQLVRCLQRAVRWARISASEKGIQLTEQGSAAVPYILGDDGALQTILSNLLSNAIRYTPSGGSIEVVVADGGSQVSVEITDSGIGMTEAEQQRVFERFYRAPEAQRVSSFGLGLGLAITRDLVSALGGTIELTSEPGVGSSFTVAFPRIEPLDTEP